MKGRGIAIGPDDCATITGSTGSSDFPTLNPFQPVMVGTKDAFVTRVDPLTAEIIFSTFLGGAGGIDEEACAVFVDETGSAFVTGRAGTGFPLLNPWQETYGGEYDAFVTRFTPWETPSFTAPTWAVPVRLWYGHRCGFSGLCLRDGSHFFH